MEGIVVHSFDETIESMKIYLEQVDGTLILVGVCDDTVLREHTVDTLRKRLPPEITLRDFRYDPEHISLLEGALEATATSNRRPAVSVTGFEALSRDKRTEAIRLLNWERGRFGLTGIAVILWVNRATLAEIATKSADFYSWRSGTFIIEPPPGWDALESTRRSYLNALVAQNEFVNLQGLAPTRGRQIVQMRMKDIFIPLRAEQEVSTAAVRFSEIEFSDSEGPITVKIAENAEGVLVAQEKTGTHKARVVGDTLVIEGKTGTQSISLRSVRRSSGGVTLEDMTPELWRAVEHIPFPVRNEMEIRRVDIAEVLQEHRAVVLGDPGVCRCTFA